MTRSKKSGRAPTASAVPGQRALQKPTLLNKLETYAPSPHHPEGSGWYAQFGTRSPRAQGLPLAGR